MRKGGKYALAVQATQFGHWFCLIGSFWPSLWASFCLIFDPFECAFDAAEHEPEMRLRASRTTSNGGNASDGVSRKCA